MALTLSSLGLSLGGCAPRLPTLRGRALLPAATFASGPPSGRLLGSGPINGQELPFESQPVQGFSSILLDDDGSFLVIVDNGYGVPENSADFHLRVYRLGVSFETAEGGDGTIEVLDHFEIADPEGQIPFVIANELTDERVLTGVDFDIESFRRAPDGTFWFGDELGPFLLHTNARGQLLEPPISLPNPAGDGDLRAPQSPLNEEGSMLRLLSSYRAQQWRAGGTASPVFSPYHALLADDDATTVIPARAAPSSGRPASSELFAVGSLQRAGFAVIPWTVNDPERMRALLELGVAGIISDYPDRLLQVLRDFEWTDETRPDPFDEESLLDATLFDAQGHRGARGLRPENTLPAFEAALDLLVTTLETDLGLTADGVLMLNHDPNISAQRCRRLDDGELEEAPLIRDLDAAAIQGDYACDGLLPRFPEQRNDHALSPVALAYAETNELADPYVMPTLEQLFDFIDFYASYYGDGEGRSHAEASRRAANAARMRFNIEIKRNPLHPELTADGAAFAASVIAAVETAEVEDRVVVQSFDHATLLELQRRHASLRTAFLVGADSLEVDEQGRSPWMANMPWPARVTAATHPFRVQPSGGLEGMALSADGRRLHPMLEKPLVGSEDRELLIFEYDLEGGAFTERTWRYPLAVEATAIGDFLMVDDRRGLVIERDDNEGDLEAFKRIFLLELDQPGELVSKRLLVDLMQIDDPDGISEPAAEGDVGLGARFALPFFTIECLALVDANHLLVGVDNNYPFSVGRHRGSGAPDDSELVLIELPEALY